MSVSYPCVPGEIVDAVIDQLYLDVETLGICGLVCSEWLNRSRYHLFSTLHLWPSRMHSFRLLVESSCCTITPFISRVEIEASSRSAQPYDAGTDMPSFCEILSLSRLSCFSRVESLRLQSIDLTAFNFQDQATIAQRLAQFASLRQLELDRIVFHDMREPVKIMALFPRIRHVSVTRIIFTKYMEHTIASASRLRFPSSLTSLKLGRGDEVPVFLSCLASHADVEIPRVRSLTLHKLSIDDMLCFKLAFRALADSLHHLCFTFCPSGVSSRLTSMSPDEIAHCSSLSDLTQLRTICIEESAAEEFDSISNPCIQNTSPFLPSHLHTHLRTPATHPTYISRTGSQRRLAPPGRHSPPTTILRPQDGAHIKLVSSARNSPFILNDSKETERHDSWMRDKRGEGGNEDVGNAKAIVTVFEQEYAAADRECVQL
ncbi:hypothetical protein Hypma_006886 [Hypsizygus marmoreus]|uniref:F-box domain-containing protein n=1 Tax=Hypsizygus marmoreus TaxID=39966 RepID=A0A369JUZ9_HYPMA|nr:hypothetical protein Hypma_006886 [Hypsizygus marmoreus]